MYKKKEATQSLLLLLLIFCNLTIRFIRTILFHPLQNGVVYIAYEDSVHNGVTYVSGTIFSAMSTTLTSGMVIPNSVIVNCNLPEKIHQEVMRTASQIMNGSIEDYSKKQDLKTDNAEA